MSNQLEKTNQKKLINSFISNEQLDELIAEFNRIREEYNLLPAQLEDFSQYYRMVTLLPSFEQNTSIDSKKILESSKNIQNGVMLLIQDIIEEDQYLDNVNLLTKLLNISKTYLREDDESSVITREEALSNVIESKEGHFVVHKVVK